MGMFDKMKDIYKLQKDAKRIKKELKNIHVEADVRGVIVTVNAEQQLISIRIPEEMNDKKTITECIIEATNKAMKKAQLIAADKMKDVMGDMGLMSS